MNVLSLFDGISAGRLALERAGIPVDTYYKSEIDKHALKVSTFHYPLDVNLGDVQGWKDWDIDWSSIDILIGGYNEYKGQCYILDGIDVSKKIQETNKECQYIFYSGCSLVENSDETIKYQKIYGENSQFHKKVVLKDKELNKKRMRILELINA